MTESSITIHTEDNAELADVREQAGTMEFRWRSANAYAASKMVPEHFRNNPQDCYVVCELAEQLGVSPLAALQNIFMIGGKPGYSAQFATALLNRSKAFAGPIRHKVEGRGTDQLSVTAYAPLHDGDVVEMTVDLALAKRENWTKNSKYKTMPEQMLKHRANKWLISMYAPEVLLGLDFEHYEDTSDKKPQNTETASDGATSNGGLSGIFDSPASRLNEAPQPSEVTITDESATAEQKETG